MVRLAANWGETGATWALGDFDGDGIVGAADASILATHWTEDLGEGTSGVPEPGVFCLLVAGVLGCAWRRQLRTPPAV